MITKYHIKVKNMKLINVCEKLNINYNENISKFGNNEIIYIRFLKKFLKDDTYYLLEEAWKKESYEEIERNAHTLKGITANLGINNLNVLTSKLVENIRNQQYDKLKDIYTQLQKEYNLTKEYIEEIE